MSEKEPAPLLILGDSSAAVCDGDFCEIPDHHEQSVINRRIDAGEF
jgi:hypothetical protein